MITYEQWKVLSAEQKKQIVGQTAGDLLKASNDLTSAYPLIQLRALDGAQLILLLNKEISNLEATVAEQAKTIRTISRPRMPNIEARCVGCGALTENGVTHHKAACTRYHAERAHHV